MNDAEAGAIKVFVAEDSVPVRARLLDILANMKGVAVVGETDSLSGAIEGIRRTEPDAVVLDIHLVGGSGMELLRKVHPLAPHIMFIVLTNHPDPRYRDVCIRDGASHFLDKSIEFGKIREIIAGLRPGAAA